MWHVSSRIAVWQPCELLYTCYLPTDLRSPRNFQPRLRLIEAHTPLTYSDWLMLSRALDAVGDARKMRRRRRLSHAPFQTVSSTPLDWLSTTVYIRYRTQSPSVISLSYISSVQMAGRQIGSVNYCFVPLLITATTAHRDSAVEVIHPAIYSNYSTPV